MVMSVKSVLTTIADKIRSYTGKTDKLKLDEMPTEIEAVYNAGKSAGGGGGSEEDYQRGYEEGRQAEYDEFWDAFQNYGNRNSYYQQFTQYTWNDTTFKPKYPINCYATQSYQTFNATQVFSNTGVTIISVPITVTGVPLTQTFYQAQKLVTISSLTLNDVPSHNSAFDGCTALKNITMGGSIIADIGFAKASLLTNASVQSIIDHLADVTGQTSLKLTLHNTVGSKLTEAQKQQITAKNWTLAY
jgi:hypothetical protein